MLTWVHYCIGETLPIHYTRWLTRHTTVSPFLKSSTYFHLKFIEGMPGKVDARWHFINSDQKVWSMVYTSMQRYNIICKYWIMHKFMPDFCKRWEAFLNCKRAWTYAIIQYFQTNWNDYFRILPKWKFMKTNQREFSTIIRLGNDG